MGKGSKCNYIALFLCAIACCGWSYVIDLKYYRLTYYSWDLPLYANLMWNLCHGSMTTTLFSGNFLIDHFNVIAFLLIPFYYFFQSALTILYFKLFAFFTGAYIFYLLTSKRLGGFWGIAFMLAYMFYPANVAMFFFEFNFENLALPVIFLLFYFFEQKRYLGFITCCLLMTIIKENMPLVVFMFGIYGFIFRKENWFFWGFIPLLLGGGMFYAEVFVFIPWLRHGLDSPNAHWSLYSNLGATPREIVQTLIFNWPKVFKILFSSHNISFLSKLFGPLLIAALLAPQVLLLGAPLFLQDLLSRFYGQQSIEFFYSSTLSVFIFMAGVECLGCINKIKVKEAFKSYFKAGFFILLLILITLLFNIEKGYFPQWRARVVPFKEKQAVGLYFVSRIPQDAKVISSYKFLYLLSQRKDLYVLFLNRKVFYYQQEVVPDDVNYMIVDFASRVDNKSYVKKLLSDGDWKVQAAADEVVLLRKNAAHGEVLIRTGNYPLSKKQMHPVKRIGDALKLDGLNIPSSLKFGQRIFRVVFYWEALKNDRKKNRKMDKPQVSFNIYKGYRRFYSNLRSPLYGLPMGKREFDREIYYYFIPQLSPGNYRIVLTYLPVKKKEDSPNPNNVIYNRKIFVLLDKADSRNKHAEKP